MSPLRSTPTEIYGDNITTCASYKIYFMKYLLFTQRTLKLWSLAAKKCSCFIYLANGFFIQITFENYPCLSVPKDMIID